MNIRFPYGKSKALTFSYDDGVDQDIRLIKLFTKYKVKGTFNLNSGLFEKDNVKSSMNSYFKRLNLKQITELYKNPNVEVAIHTACHLSLPSLNSAKQMLEVVNDRNTLEHIFKKTVRGMAYPFGDYDEKTIQILKDADIAYARTVYCHHSFSLPKDWLKLGTTCHHNDKELMTLAEKFINEDPSINSNDPFLFYVWGHSYEFKRDNNWYVMEEFLEKVALKDDVWYATNIEIYDYINAYNNLIISADGRIVQNQSAYTIWINNDGKNYEIPSGATISL